MPTSSKKEQQKRKILADLLVDAHAAYKTRYGDIPYERALVIMTIRAEQISGRAPDQSTIAERTGIPRSSVVRHLDELGGRGYVRTGRIGKRAVSFLPAGSDRKETQEFYDAMLELVSAAAREPAKLDDTIAR